VPACLVAGATDPLLPKDVEVIVRRRICTIGAILSVASLVFGGVAAAAVKRAAKHGAKPKPVGFKPVAKSTCKTDTGITVARGDNTVTPPVANGVEFGSARCGKLFGKGVERDSFQVPDSGENKATYVLYFPTGTIHGKYVLTPQEGDFGPSSFTETDYLGTLTITGGTGTYKGAKGVGTMTCKTLDGIHTTCTDKLKLARL
jgi:hypothetical protein